MVTCWWEFPGILAYRIDYEGFIFAFSGVLYNGATGKQVLVLQGLADCPQDESLAPPGSRATQTAITAIPDCQAPNKLYDRLNARTVGNTSIFGALGPTFQHVLPQF